MEWSLLPHPLRNNSRHSSSPEYALLPSLRAYCVIVVINNYTINIMSRQLTSFWACSRRFGSDSLGRLELKVGAEAGALAWSWCASLELEVRAGADVLAWSLVR